MKNLTFKIILLQIVLSATSLHLFAQINSMQRSKVNTSSSAAATASSIVKQGIYYIKIVETNKYLGIEGINPENGARLVQWDFADLDNHKFLISPTPDGYYLIKALHSNRYLNVGGQSIEDGEIICQWDYVDQDNLKWRFYYNSSSGSYTIRNKQSDKELKLQTNIYNANNGVLLSINGNPNAGTQNFILQPVNPAKAAYETPSVQLNTALQDEVVQIRLPDGALVNRSINPKYETMKKGSAKKVIQQREDGECVTKTATITMESKDFVPVTASTYLEYNAPGLIYDIRRFYGGDYTNKQEFPNGENRNPIAIVTSVRNKTGNIYEPVVVPTKTNINQAIKNLQDSYTLDRLQTTNQSMIYRSTYVESNTEMELKLGASANYMTSSFSADMKIKNARETKTFFIEADKELFTLSADMPQNGFFNTQVPGIENLGYISQVSYGVKVIGKIEVDNSVESLSTDFQAMISAGFAGGSFDFASFSKESHKNIKCFFYVVGGMSDKVTGTNIADIYDKINDILATVNYKTCMPIRIKFTQITTGNTVSYKDATNNFNYEVCTPKAIAEANKDYSINVNSMSAIGSDIQLYGDMWVELWSPAYGDLKKYRTTNNSLFSVRNDVHLERPDLERYVQNLPTVYYKNIPAQMAADAEIHVYYNLFDYDEIGSDSDDLLKLRGGDYFVTKKLPGSNLPLEGFYRRIIAVKDIAATNATGGSLTVTDDLVDGDGVSISYSCNETLQQTAQKK
jgi:hypothetical protein